MTNSRSYYTDVLVVGAGPVGLMMAGELARHGIKPRIIEKAPAPSDKSKAFGIHARTMEIFENLGIVERFLKEGNICNGLNFYDEGKELAEIDLSHIESKYPFVLILAQSITERLLAEHLYSFGIEVERETELIGFEQSKEGVVAKVKLKDGGEEPINCAYLVGCDGGRSAIRKLAGFAFTGAPPSLTMYQCVLDLDHPERLPRGVTRTSEGVLIHGPRPRRLGLHDFSGPPADRKAPVTREEVEGAANHWLPPPRPASACRRASCPGCGSRRPRARWARRWSRRGRRSPPGSPWRASGRRPARTR